MIKYLTSRKLKKLEDYWNNKHPKEKIIYDGRGMRNYNKRIDIDVRQMVWEDDYILQGIVKKSNLVKETMDLTAHACQRYVCRHLRYIGDEKSSKLEECWQFPNETVLLKTGDCEDGAILMASLMLNAGIPSWRVRVTAGMVQEAPTAEAGGHAYVTYCREQDNNWVILDWCYFADSKISVSNKPLANKVKYYKDIWFSFNNLFSWSHKRYGVIKSIKKEPK